MAWGSAETSRWEHSVGKTVAAKPGGRQRAEPRACLTSSSRPASCSWARCMDPPVLHRRCDCPLGWALQIQTKVLLADDAVCTAWTSAHLSLQLAPLCVQE